MGTVFLIDIRVRTFLDRQGFGLIGLLFALFTSKKHSPPPWRPGRQGGRGGVGWVAGWLGGKDFGFEYDIM